MRKTVATLSAGAALAGLWVWNRSRSRSGPTGSARGEAKRWRTAALEAGAMLMQDKSPLRAMNTYLNGFHFYADNMGHQVEAHHFCTNLNEEFTQCVIFDGNTSDARLIGIEYIVSERLFAEFPDEDKRLWHSHSFEVRSGTLIAPNLPLAAEHELMKRVIRTYGKVFHTWDTTNFELPMGIPKLMMAFTAEGQLHEDLLERRDRNFKVSTARHKENRADIPSPPLLPGADSWLTGHTVQLRVADAVVSGSVAG